MDLDTFRSSIMYLFTSCSRTDQYDRHKGDASIAAAEAIGTHGLKRHMTFRLCAQPELWLKGSARWQKAYASANVSSELKIHYSVPLLPIGVAEVVVPSPFAAVGQIERMSAPLRSTATRNWSGDSRVYHNVDVCASRLAINIAADRNWRPSIGISFSLTSWMELVKSSFVVAFATSSP